MIHTGIACLRRRCPNSYLCIALMLSGWEKNCGDRIHIECSVPTGQTMQNCVLTRHAHGDAMSAPLDLTEEKYKYRDRALHSNTKKWLLRISIMTPAEHMSNIDAAPLELMPWITPNDCDHDSFDFGSLMEPSFNHSARQAVWRSPNPYVRRYYIVD